MSTILVVEDDPRIDKRRLHRQFTMEGYTVQVAGDGAEGLATCKTLRPAGVVLDLDASAHEMDETFASESSRGRRLRQSWS